MDKATAAYFRMNAAKQMKGKKNMSELGNASNICKNTAAPRPHCHRRLFTGDCSHRLSMGCGVSDDLKIVKI